jgi:hypothetical protein
VIFLFGA